MSDGAHLRMRPRRGNTPEDMEYMAHASVWMDPNEPARKRTQAYEFTTNMNKGIFGNPLFPGPMEAITVIKM
jgi:hypothetical protein